MIGLVKKSIFLSLLVSAFMVLVVGGFISLRPIVQLPAHAQGEPAPACDNLEMAAGKTLTDPYMPGQTNAG